LAVDVFYIRITGTVYYPMFGPSSAPGFSCTSRLDIIHVQTQVPTPMSNTANRGERGRFLAPRKAATALRLLRGESLELLSRELGVTAATLASLKSVALASSWLSGEKLYF
jgi:hypothetical protein